MSFSPSSNPNLSLIEHPYLLRSGSHEGAVLYRADVFEALAKAYVLETDKAHLDGSIIFRYLPPDWPAPPPRRQWIGRNGGVKGIYERIGQGGLGINDRLGCWTGEFWSGLRLSGALRPGAGRQFDIWERTHWELLADLAEMKLSRRLESCAGLNGTRRRRRCPVAHLPPDDPTGPRVVAGLFAGSVMREHNNEQWLQIPASEDVQELLRTWSIVPRHSFQFRGKEKLLISPFYSALFCALMPPHSSARIQELQRPGDCPLLPLLYWDLAWSRPHHRWPVAGELPWACSRATAYRHGIKRKELHRTAVTERGITGVASCLRQRMREWIEAYHTDRVELKKAA